MSNNLQTKGIANADLSASQWEGVTRTGTSERLAAQTISSDRMIGVLLNSDADTAADQVQLAMSGQVKMIAAEALQPFDEVSVSTAGRAKVADSGDVIIGIYVPELRSGGTDLPAAAAADEVRVFLYGSRQRKSEIVWGKATYSFAVDGGTEGVIAMSNQGVIPSGATVIHSFFRVRTTCTSSGDAATLALATSAGGVTFVAATAISANAAQVITLTPPAVNSLELFVNISADWDGSGVAEVVPSGFTTDGDGSAAEAVTALTAQINANMDQVGAAGHTVVATGSGTLILTAEGTFLGTRPFKAVGGGGGTFAVADTTAFTYGNRWDADSGPGNDGIIPGPHQISRPSTWEEMSAAGTVTLTTAGSEDLTAGIFDLVYAYIPV